MHDPHRPWCGGGPPSQPRTGLTRPVQAAVSGPALQGGGGGETEGSQKERETGTQRGSQEDQHSRCYIILVHIPICT